MSACQKLQAASSGRRSCIARMIKLVQLSFRFLDVRKPGEPFMMYNLVSLLAEAACEKTITSLQPPEHF